MYHQRTKRKLPKLHCNPGVRFTIALFLSVPVLLVPSLVQSSNELFAQRVTEEYGIEAARQVIKAFNTGNVSNVSSFISDQYINHESQIDPVRGQLRGPTEFIDTVENNRIAFPDLRHNEEAIIVEGDTVVSVLNVTGTHTGNFFILPPTGNEISYDAVHIYRVGEDGKIVEHKAIRDDLTFLARLGVIEPSSPEYVPFFEVLTGTGNMTS